jgi:hypothetical protein
MAAWGRRPEGEGYKTPEIGGISDEFLLMERLVGINRLGVDVFSWPDGGGRSGRKVGVLGFEIVGTDLIDASQKRRSDSARLACQRKPYGEGAAFSSALPMPIRLTEKNTINYARG